MRTPIQIVRAVLFALVAREFLGRFMLRRMGAVWTLIEPLLHILLLTLFFTYIRGNHIDGIEYPIYLISALVPFFLYRNIAIRLMDGVDANRGLFAYKQIKPLDALIARTIVEVVIMTSVYAVLIFIFTWFGLDTSVHRPLEWVATLCVGVIFAFGFGIILAILTNALPDIKTFVRLMFFPLYFISGVIYPPSAFPADYLYLFLWNPFLHLNELIRHFIFANYTVVRGVSFEYVFYVTLVFLFIALGLYRIRRFKLISI